jgi:methylthioribulose 1-phosphate dehydratase/enolase-phosphatase E1
MPGDPSLSPLPLGLRLESFALTDGTPLKEWREGTKGITLDASGNCETKASLYDLDDLKGPGDLVKNGVGSNAELGIAATHGQLVVYVGDMSGKNPVYHKIALPRADDSGRALMLLIPENVPFRVGAVSANECLPSGGKVVVCPGDPGIFLTKSEASSASKRVVELCRAFYHLGWCSGSGGSITIRFGDLVLMTPSGVQKERIQPEELFSMDTTMNIQYRPPSLKLTACSKLFEHAYVKRGAGAVIHSHGMECVAVTLIAELKGQTEFRVQHLEMVKGVPGYGYHDEVVVPIIDNVAHEADLADSLGAAIDAYPNSCAVLVKRHGIYVWGSTWEKAKTQCESLHYLFEMAVKMHDLGMDPSKPPVEGCTECGTLAAGHGGAPPAKRSRIAPPASSSRPSILLLDIEGTTTPISFVKEVMFPYAADHLQDYLVSNKEAKELILVVDALRDQQQQDCQAMDSDFSGAPAICGVAGASLSDATITDVIANVRWNMALDRKLGPMKELQGMIWRSGFERGALCGALFPDTAGAMKKWAAIPGKRVAIYSSGSREAQRLLFSHSVAGNLGDCISAYFDTKIGHKREVRSYEEIALTLGVPASDIIFATDIYEEAEAAASAGCKVTIMLREGNGSLPDKQPYPTALTLQELL